MSDDSQPPVTLAPGVWHPHTCVHIYNQTHTYTKIKIKAKPLKVTEFMSENYPIYLF